MCLQDVKIGRKTFGNMQTKQLSVALSAHVSPNPMRRVLILSPHDTIDYYVCMSDNGTSQGHLRISKGTDNLVLNVDEHGDIVTRGLWAFAASGTPTVGFYEAEFAADETV